MRRVLSVLLAVVLVATSGLSMAGEHGMHRDRGRTAIVLAFFGTTYPSGLKAVVNILDHVKKAFPHTEVKVTFTSNIIRSIWRERQGDAQKWLSQGVPKEILYVKDFLGVMGELRDEGYKNVIVQSTHIYHGEEVEDLMAYIRAIRSIRTVKAKWRPFNTVAFGRPIFGDVGDRYDYHEDLKRGVGALKADVELARRKGAVLVYMGHGNEFWSTGIYAEAQKMLRTLYPDVRTFVGTVEGYPSLDDVVEALKREARSKKVILKPLMVVAGDHAHNDMAGPGKDSWKNVLEAAGFQVEPVLHGLGENDEIAEIVVEHVKDAAKDAGLVVR